MIFFLVKLIVWLLGVATLVYIALPYVGYEVNWDYWNESKVVCQKQLEACKRDLIKTGLEGIKEKCDIQCVDTKALIERIEKDK